MADIIGAATLELGIDLRPLQRGLQDAKKLVEQFQGSASQNLGKALGAPAEQVARLTQATKEATKETASLLQLLNRPPGASYDKITAQVRVLRDNLNDLKTVSQEYVQTLTRIRELEITRDRRIGRQRVNADFEAFRSPTLRSGFGSSDRLPGLPNTVAGDIQLLRELSQNLNNVEKNSAEYDIVLRKLEATQRRVTQALSGQSDTYRQLEQQENAAIRRAGKIAALQEYYASKNPRAGGIRDANGNLLARGAGTVADEKAYNAAIRPARELLEADLRREQTLRRIGQRLQENAKIAEGGFGSFSSSRASQDPVTKSIERNRRRVAARAAREQEIRDIFDADLARVREQRLSVQNFAALPKPGLPPRIPQSLLTGGQRARDARRRETQGAIASATIGGFFPLLFGQGFGSAIGGAVGGGLGPRFLGGAGGFAGGVAGTAVGAQLDAAIQRLGTLGSALRDPVANFKALQDAALLSSRSVERNVESLIAAGRAEEAAAVARADLARLGTGPEIQSLITAQDELKRTYAELSVGVATFTAGPLAALLRAINGSLRGAPGVGSAVVGAIGGALNPFGAAAASIGRAFNPAAGGGGAADPRRQVTLQRELASISARRTTLTNAEARAAIAASQGYRKLALERENEASAIREGIRLRDPSVQGAERLPQRLEIVREEQALRRKNALDIQRIERDAAREQRATDRDTADRLAASRDELFLAERLRGSRGATRSILEEQNKVIGAGLARQRAFDRLRAAEADPALTSNDLAKLRTDFRIAGDELSKQVVASGDALRTAARDAAKSLRDARLSVSQAELGVRGANTSLASLRSGPNSIAQFLDPTSAALFQNNTLRNLLPTFRRNFGSFNQTLTASGISTLPNSFTADLQNRVDAFARGDFNDTPRVTNLLRDVLNFNNAVEGDVSAQQALTAATNTLLDATRTFTDAARDNAAAQAALATPLAELAAKDWTVYVQPPLVNATPGGFGLQ